ncbi:hypothetical protein AYO40_05225 [Planctomycetaceae bacterium SCGC AG-212-D15]|nr:hypothetical protein AYO40_05225 [Planctomycetaceae bacterium SCGC AG-212-D15]
MPVEFVVGAAVGAAAVAVSSRVRRVVGHGLLRGVGGVLLAYDKVAAAAHNVARSAREAATSPNGAATAECNGSLAADTRNPQTSATSSDG